MKIISITSPLSGKLFSFVLRTDAWSNGDTLSNKKEFDIDYIEKQFKKLPLENMHYEGGAKILTVTNDTNNKGILKLFTKLVPLRDGDAVEQIVCDKLVYEEKFDEAINTLILEKGQEILLDIKTIIGMYKKMCFTSLKLQTEIQGLEGIINETVPALKNNEQFLKIKSRKSHLEAELSLTKEHKMDVLLRIASFLCQVLYIQGKISDIVREDMLPETLVNQVLDFIEDLYPKISKEDSKEFIEHVVKNYTSYVQNIDKNNSPEVIEHLQQLKTKSLEFIEEAKEALDNIQKCSFSRVKEDAYLTAPPPAAAPLLPGILSNLSGGGSGAISPSAGMFGGPGMMP